MSTNNWGLGDRDVWLGVRVGIGHSDWLEGRAFEAVQMKYVSRGKIGGDGIEKNQGIEFWGVTGRISSRRYPSLLV